MAEENIWVNIGVKGVDKFVNAMKTADKYVEKSATTWDKAGQSAAKSSQSMVKGANSVMKGLKGLGEAVTFIRTGIIQPLQQGAEQFVEFARSAAQGVAVRDSFKNMAEGVGASSDKMIAALRKASKGTVSDTKLMLSANTAMALGVAKNHKQMARLMEIARVKARQFGLSTEQAFSDITRGIGRLSPMILDNLGITIDAERTYAEYAVTIGKTADKLSDMEKRQALVARIVKESAAEVEKARAATDTYIDAFERWDATAANASQTMGELFLPAVTDVLEILTGLTEQTTTFSTQSLPLLWEGFKKAFEQVDKGQVALTDLAPAMFRNAIAMSQVSEKATEAAADVFDLNKALRENKEAAVAAIEGAQGFIKAWTFTGEQAVKSIDNQKQAIEELGKIERRRAETNEVWEAIIRQQALVTSDARVQAAINAMTREDERHRTALETRQASITAHNAWVESEEARIAQLRADKRWEEAGVAEQALNHAKVGFQNDLVSREDLQKKHDDKMKGLNAEYWAAIKSSRDQDIKLALARWDSEIRKLGEYEAALQHTARTGSQAADDWAGAWKKANARAFSTDKIDEWDRHLRRKLDKPFSFEIRGVYIPPPLPGRTGGVGRTGEFAQGGGVVPGPLGRPIPIIAHGREIIVDPLAPMRGLRALARAGLLGTTVNQTTTNTMNVSTPMSPGMLGAEFDRMDMNTR